MGAWGTGIFEDDHALDWAADWVRSHPLQVNDELLQLARTAIHRIATDSELRELWAESDELNQWQATVKNLESRLSVA